MPRVYRQLPVLLAALCGSPSLPAHEFWLLAHPFETSGGEAIEISLWIGENLDGQSQPNELRDYVDFSYRLWGEPIAVPGERGRDPAGVIEDYPVGDFAVGYQSVRRYGEFSRAKFNQYLLDEGLPAVILPVGKRDIVEHYTRYAKTLVSGGPRGIDATAESFGFRLELHALQNPYRLARGEPLELQLTWQGQPAAGLLVKAFCADIPEQQQRQRSDQRGRVTIRPDCAGTWLVNAVKLLPSAEPGIDFESFWASLTFQRR